MAENGIEHQDIYDYLMGRLKDRQLGEIVQEIHEIISRGYGVPRIEEEFSKNTQIYLEREFDSKGRLAVALRVIIAYFETPLFLNHALRVLDCDKIQVEIDSSGNKSEIWNATNEKQNFQEIESRLRSIRTIMEELGVCIPRG